MASYPDLDPASSSVNIPAIVRTATPDDAQVLARMLHDFNLEFEDPSPGITVLEPRVRASINDGSFHYLLGGEGPDGFAQVMFRTSIWTERPIVHLDEFYVVPDRRGEGIGRAMMEALFDFARDHEAARICLTTGEDDTVARRLYERFGFVNHLEGINDSRSLFYETPLESHGP